jgi:hypothetical protein
VNQGPDAAIDSNIDADLTAPLTVITLARFQNTVPDGMPVANIEIIALRPDGSQSDDVKTDTTGMAQVKVYPGGSVTALYPHPSDPGADLTTYMGVKPGDTITFGQQVYPTMSTTLGNFTLTWPNVAVGEDYSVITSCYYCSTGTGLGCTVTEYNTCHQEPMDILYLGYSPSVGAYTYSAFASAVPFTSGGSKSLNAWSAMGTGSMAITGIPSEVTNVYAANYDFVGNDIAFSTGYSSAPSNGQYTTPSYAWPSAGQGTRNSEQVQLTRPGPYTTMAINETSMGNTPTYTLNISALPPWLTTNYTVSGPAQMATWYAIGEGPTNGTALRVYWSHPNGANYTWSFLVPPKVNAITFPKLPANIEMNAPALDDNLNIVYLRIFNIPELASYDDVRKVPERHFQQLDYAVRLGLFKSVIMNY